MNDRFKKHVWIGASVILGSILTAYIVFYFLAASVHNRAAQVIAQKTAAQSKASAIASFAALKTDAPMAAQYEATIQKLIPSQSGLIVFNTWVAQYAKNYGAIATVAFQNDIVPATAGAPGSAHFTMTASGPENSIMPFVDYISSKAPGFILSFSSFDFTNDRTRENLTAQGVVYFR